MKKKEKRKVELIININKLKEWGLIEICLFKILSGESFSFDRVDVFQSA